jgi:hypothetical protein
VLLLALCVWPFQAQAATPIAISTMIAITTHAALLSPA